jgi:hypothetical protein
MCTRIGRLALCAGVWAVLTTINSWALNNKCGIDISFSGVSGTDCVVEPLYCDSFYDDHAVVYLKSSVDISLAHNANIDD